MTPSIKAPAVSRSFFKSAEYAALWAQSASKEDRFKSLSAMLRLDTLSTVFWAGTGHLGASLSAIEMLAALYFDVMTIDPSHPNERNRDVFLLSKGHAAPAHYAVLAASGYFDSKKLKTFRRRGGLARHVDVEVPGVDGSTGSLGMGISKAKGYAWAAKQKGMPARAFAMVGDGELQEGQLWEAFQTAVHMRLDNLFVLVDRNHVQTDRLVKDIVEPLSIEEKLRAFGWETLRIDGHHAENVSDAITRLSTLNGKPKAIIADTIKGKGISFMEHPTAMAKDGGYYYWHAKVPSQAQYHEALSELMTSITPFFPVETIPNGLDSPLRSVGSSSSAKALVDSYSRVLLRLAEENNEWVVIDGDLEESCGLRPFRLAHPDRFIELGCAEQDMVSMAGALSRAGTLPLVNTYSAFLSSRANEQIFNSATEYNHVIYVGHMAGLIPATPGKSHQAVRDIAVFNGIPTLLVLEPASEMELESLLRYAMKTYKGPTYFRIANAPASALIPSPTHAPQVGVGQVLQEGSDAAVFVYGPIPTAEVLDAAARLKSENISIRVIQTPWLNRLDQEWFAKVVQGVRFIYVVENHADGGGLGDLLARALSGNPARYASTPLRVLGLRGFAQSGLIRESLDGFGLSAEAFMERWRTEIQ